MPAKRTRVTRVCEHCSTPFWITPSEIKKGGGKFCRIACAYAARRQRALATLREPIATRLPNGCLIPAGGRDELGYGRRLGGKSGRKPAHVLSWEMANGREFPEGMFGCHNCPGGDNPACVEPTHIWPGTAAENSADMVAKGRAARGIKNTNAKLTEKAVLDIRARYRAGGITLIRLANEYGVTKTLIGYVVRGDIWQHVGS